MIYMEYAWSRADKNMVNAMTEALSRRYWSGRMGTVAPGGGIDANGNIAPGLHWLLAWSRSFKNLAKRENPALTDWPHGIPSVIAYPEAGKILNPTNPFWKIFDPNPPYQGDCDTNPNRTWCRPWDGYNPVGEALQKFKDKWHAQKEQSSTDECGVYFVWDNHVTLTYGQEKKSLSPECDRR